MDPVDASDYLGLPSDEATAKAEQRGWVVRLLPPGAVMTMDWRSDRLNLRVDDDGTVVDVEAF